MSIETEIKAVEQDATKDVAAVVTDVKHDGDFVISAVTKDVDASAQKVEAGIVKTEVAFKKSFAAAEKQVGRLSADEKLALRSIETEFLRVQLDIKNLVERATAIEKQFTQTVEGFARKYSVNTVEHVFDIARQDWQKIEAAVKKAL